MGNELAGLSTMPQKKQSVTITRVANGFLVGTFTPDQKIANTLPEALELARKEIE